MALIKILLDTGADTDVPDTSDKTQSAHDLSAYFHSLAVGSRIHSSSLELNVNPIRASGTLTINSDPASASLGGVINGISVVVPFSGTVEEAGPVWTAHRLMEAINVSTSSLHFGQISASYSSNVVKLTSVAPGSGSNLFTLARFGAAALVTASAANFQAGTSGTFLYSKW